LDSKELAVLAAQAADDKKATDILAMDVAELLVVTDYFVLATGNTDVQVKAIADEVEDRLREQGGAKPIGREGRDEGKWVLLDFGDLVVHVFQPEERDFYRLEKLWSEAPRLDVGLGGTAPETPEPAPAS
jgi:ribosome-associated protein